MLTAPPHLVVGGGPAAASAARVLAASGADVLLITAEDRPPYDRTTLSKRILLDHCAPPPPLWQDSETWTKNVTVRLGTRVLELRPVSRTVRTDRGETVRYERLLLATGSRPRRLELPGAAGPGVHYLREYADARSLGGALAHARRLVILGGGVIGLEVAAVAATRGLDVEVVEMAPRVLGRGVPGPVARWLADVHRAHGVRLRVGAAAAQVNRSAAGTVTGVRLADGSGLAADLVVVGVGIAPRDDLARQAGLDVDDGIVVDPRCRTSHPEIYAAGDVARMRRPGDGAGTRHESYQAAQRQGEVAAHAMLGQGEHYGDVPWTWSDQYDVTMQSAGLASPGDTDLVLESADAVLVLSFDGERLVAACGAARGTAIARPVGAARLAIASGGSVDRRALAAAGADLAAITRILRGRPAAAAAIPHPTRTTSSTTI